MKMQAFPYNPILITNMYHFNLITLVVIDEYGEGIPVALMLSNREDAISLIPFFATIKGISGVILHISNLSWFAEVLVDQTVVSPGLLGKETTALCVVDQTLPL